MKNKLLIPVVAIILVVVAVAAAIPIIEKGMASRAETDSTEDIEPGQFVKAVSTDGKPVAIPSVTYALSEDMESYELADTTRSTSGSLRVKTPDDVNMGMRVVVSFYEPGSWLFIETINMSLNAQTGYIVLVENGKSLTGNTVVWVDENGIVKTEYNVSSSVTRPAGWTNYLIWGKDEKSSESYTLVNSDIYKGFVVIVKSGCNISGYNIIKMYASSNPAIDMNRPIGYKVPDKDNDQYKKWRVWNTGNLVTGYTVASTDAYDKSGTSSKYTIYNSLSGTGVATNPSDKITVKTGYYNYTIEVKYKQKIMVDPTDYQGEFMESTILFIVDDTDPIPTTVAEEPEVPESP